MNWVNSRNGFAMMTVPSSRLLLLLLAGVFHFPLFALTVGTRRGCLACDILFHESQWLLLEDPAYLEVNPDN